MGQTLQQVILSLQQILITISLAHTWGGIESNKLLLLNVIMGEMKLTLSFSLYVYHFHSHEKAKEAIFYSYNKHINGFAAVLGEEEAAKIASK